MPNGKPVGPEERQRIIDLLHEHGGNQNKVSRMVKRSQTTVGKIANEEGIDSVNSAPKKALQAKKAVEEINRLEFITDLLTVGKNLSEELHNISATDDRVKAYKDLMVGVAIGIDKHRLETGEVTDRTESQRSRGIKDILSAGDTEAEAEWQDH